MLFFESGCYYSLFFIVVLYDNFWNEFQNFFSILMFSALSFLLWSCRCRRRCCCCLMGYWCIWGIYFKINNLLIWRIIEWMGWIKIKFKTNGIVLKNEWWLNTWEFHPLYRLDSVCCCHFLLEILFRLITLLKKVIKVTLVCVQMLYINFYFYPNFDIKIIIQNSKFNIWTWT